MNAKNFRTLTQEYFLSVWQKYPSATLHWKLFKNEEGYWEMREGKRQLLTHIPHWVGDWVWRQRGLAISVYPNKNAQTCDWHLILK